MLYATEAIVTGTVKYETAYPHYINLSISIPDFKNNRLQGCKYKTLFTVVFTNKKHKSKLIKWFKENMTTVTSPAICFNEFNKFAEVNNIDFKILDN